MRYISICSGIEAATVAWQPLGWQAVAFAEIEPFPCRLLKAKYPDVPNVGDITKADWSEYADGTVGLIVGGTPCQSFSAAGTLRNARTGLSGPSGLVREFIRILHEINPQYFVWENVPGVLSLDNGDVFKRLLREWQKCGYSCAWRVLNSEFFGVPQRRNRLFVIGHSANWKRPIQVLFDQESGRRNTPQGKRQEKENRPGTKGCADSNRKIAKALTTSNQRLDWETETFIPGSNTVRRLTPLECERLQGFPDGYTDIPGASDGVRYKALGNSMCVNVMRWIGERIQEVENGTIDGKAI